MVAASQVGEAESVRRILFVSSNLTWGGSEDLWSETAARLAKAGHRVTACKNRFDDREPAVQRLAEAGARLLVLARFPLLPRLLYARFAFLCYPLTFVYEALHLYLRLRLRRRPDLVVVSQGGNHDGWLLASVCVRLGIPFVLICQKATDLYWPPDSRRERVRRIYEQAKHAFFVSAHNLRLTEEQLGRRIEHGSVVRNPFKVAWDARPAWPGTDLGLRLACVGRLYPKEKGQDLLLRVLARHKWRRRAVGVTIYGSGEQAQGLADMAEWFGLDNVRFAGFVEDVEAVWSTHHALVLPSRAEGLPLVLVEAMLCGRVAVVTDVAGNREIVEDNVTGFLAAAPTEDSLDEAMERAWQRRGEWQAIGQAAAESIRNNVPQDPAAALAATLVELARGRPPAAPEQGDIAARPSAQSDFAA